jgi:hypothetical protein
MPVLTIQSPGLVPENIGAGNTPDAGGDTCDNTNGKTMFRMTNTNGASRTVTVVAQKADPNASTTYNDIAAVLPATTGDMVMGPFGKDIYNDVSKALTFTYDAVTGVTIWAWEP